MASKIADHGPCYWMPWMDPAGSPGRTLAHEVEDLLLALAIRVLLARRVEPTGFATDGGAVVTVVEEREATWQQRTSQRR